MIQLDTDYLIAGARSGTPENTALHSWLGSGEQLALSAIVWMEFVTGPLDPSSVALARSLVEDRILPASAKEAELAAELYNFAGRRRGLRIDCLIAATAINAGARLATRNTADYRVFVPRGLILV